MTKARRIRADKRKVEQGMQFLCLATKRMSQCVYCLKTEESTSFKRREHVLPQFLGSFTPLNPTIRGDLVCDSCNSDFFGPLEANFKEDSEEGITCQMLNLENKSSVRLRGKNVKLSFENDMGDDFFNQAFRFLRPNQNNDGLEAYLEPQIKLKNYDGVYQIFLPKALERLKTNKTEFQDIKRRLAKLRKEDIQIFAGSNFEGDTQNHDYIVALLAEYGVIYQMKESKFTSTEGWQEKKVEVSMDCTINPPLERVIAKIAFNYFIYCALQEGKSEILFNPIFDTVKRFIMGDEVIKQEQVIQSIDGDPILIYEKDGDKRLVSHIIVFSQRGNEIMAKVTLFGKRVYEICLGSILSEFCTSEFGCGHIFNPFSHEILSIKQKGSVHPSEEEVAKSFGLYKRG